MTKFILILTLLLLNKSFIYGQEKHTVNTIKKSISPFSKEKNLINKNIDSLYKLGEEFFIKGDMDLSLFYFSKSATEALQTNNLKILPSILVNVADIWNKNYYIKRSSKLLFAILSLAKLFNDYESLSHIYMAISYNYFISYEGDLALKKARESKNMADLSKNSNAIVKSLLGIVKLELNNKLDIQAKLHSEDMLAESKKIDNIHLKTTVQILYATLLLDSNYIQAKYIVDSINNSSSILSKENEIDMLLLEAKLGLKEKDFAKSTDIILNLLPEIQRLNWEEKEVNALEILLQTKAHIIADSSIILDIDKFNTMIAILTSQYNSSAINNLQTRYDAENQENIIAVKSLLLEKKQLENLYYLLLTFILFIIIISLMFYLKRNQKRFLLRQENELLQLQQSIHTLELNNYNKQLDPHEIKNLIASIAPEIQKKAPNVYKKMIKLFNITRASLNNGLYENLEIQLQQAEDLLILHQTLFSNNITYTIKQNNNSNPNLPRLILKNIIESILKNKTSISEKHVDIELNNNNYYTDIKIKTSILNDYQEKLTYNPFNTILNTYQKTFGIINQKNYLKASLKFEQFESGFQLLISIPNNYTYPY